MRGNARRRGLLAKVRERTVALLDFICGGCGDLQESFPVYGDWHCTNCEYSAHLKAVALS